LRFTVAARLRDHDLAVLGGELGGGACRPRLVSHLVRRQAAASEWPRAGLTGRPQGSGEAVTSSDLGFLLARLRIGEVVSAPTPLGPVSGELERAASYVAAEAAAFTASEGRRMHCAW